ncbi:DNA repair protein RecO [Aquiflexum sp.]|uniref:DNA repair protein RecO n=1 Tax=Aquiflexum sp. TaxID=1872584 RepID=UPI003594431D
MKLKKTKGLVISFLKYRETSIIVRIFTRDLGLKSYIVNGVRSKGAKSKMAFYQPLTQLDMVVYDKEGASLNRISEVKLAKAYEKIPFDFQRSSIAMFMGEVLGKSIYDDYQNESFYDFLEYSLDQLDKESVILVHFPLVFLWECSKYLGFAPNDAASFFDELTDEAYHPGQLKEEIDYLNALIEESFACNQKVHAIHRKKLLDHFLMFYSRHLESPYEWKSVKVLRQLLG